MADYHHRIVHPDVKVADLEQRLADLAGEDEPTRRAYERPVEQKLEAAKARQAARQRQDAAAETASPRELAALVPR